METAELTRKPRYCYNYKGVYWVLMEWELKYEDFPMTLYPAMNTETRMRLIVANAHSSARPYQA